MVQTCHFVRSTYVPLLLAFVILGLGKTGTAQTIDANFFRDRIKPILSNHCYTCHGPDEKTREGGFRFDVQESAFGLADSGLAPIVPGNVDASELLKRIHASDDSRMPPRDQERQLSDDDKALLRNWIEGGAPWQQHWAFIAPGKPDIPPLAESAESTWAKNEIDHFVLRRLREQGITPSAMADRATLLRRLSLDLTGLPPTPEEVQGFVRDESPDAYERVVDRLLSSPHYGEHLATAWLDAARFADTNGYQNDFSRKMWPWRDWVIEAFNANMPFDQFTIEQLAGDMLPNATERQKIASGFHRNNRSVTEGGSIDAEWHVENVVDRVETTSTVFLGLTMGCARCHDHKFDPISQKEFYEFFAYFNSSKDRGVYNEKRGNFGPMLTVVGKADEEKVKVLIDRILAVELELHRLAETSAERQLAWETQFAQAESLFADDYSAGIANAVDARPETLETIVAELGDNLKTSASPFRHNGSEIPAIQISGEDGSHVDLGQHFVFDGEKPFSISAWVRPTKFGAILSRMDEPNSYRGFDLLMMDDGRLNVHLIHQWPGNAIKVTTKSKIVANVWTHVLVSYDGSKKANGLKIYFDQREIGFNVNNNNLTGSTLTDHPLWLGYRAYTKRFGGELSQIRLYDRVINAEERRSLLDAPVRSVVAIAKGKRSELQQKFLTDKFRRCYSVAEAEKNKQLAQAKSELEKFRKRLPTTMIMEELSNPRKTYLLNRGQYDQPDTSVELQPGVPAFLPAPDRDLPKNRLGLARWLVTPDHPLTARVTVNRFWQNIFGNGLLDTPENFGVQSATPSHPALLDWLAIRFVESGWDVKAFHKMMVMSATYRQVSNVSADQLALDPINRWLGRGARYRMTAEMIRDNALAISGKLTRRIGGPSMKPYQPKGVWRELAGGAGEPPYVQATDENLYRRSMYIYRKRTVPHPTMSTFDAGSREVCQVARQRTNTPLQALALLNDQTYVEAARLLAIECLKTSDELEQQVAMAFERATLRKPSDRETEILVNAFVRYQKNFESDPASANEFLSFGVSKPDEKIEASSVAALTVVCSTILNLDETITRE